MKRAAIIMLGNGFDLHCGLPTSYSEYINARKGTNMEDNGVFRYIRAERHGSWIDVEEEILNIINGISELEKDHKILKKIDIVDVKYLKLICILNIANPYNLKTNQYQFNENVLGGSFVSYKAINTLINNWLKELCDDIKNYLEEVSNSPLIKESLKKFIDRYEEIEVINYNYNANFLKYNNSANIIYYHGKLSEKIIIGHNEITNPNFGEFNKKTQKIRYAYNVNVESCIKKFENDWKNDCTIDFIIMGHSVDANDIEAYNCILSNEVLLNNIIIVDYCDDSLKKITNLNTHLTNKELIDKYSKQDKLLIVDYENLDKYDFENTDIENIKKMGYK